MLLPRQYRAKSQLVTNFTNEPKILTTGTVLNILSTTVQSLNGRYLISTFKSLSNTRSSWARRRVKLNPIELPVKICKWWRRPVLEPKGSQCSCKNYGTCDYRIADLSTKTNFKLEARHLTGNDCNICGGSVAEWLGRRTWNPEVAGSSLALTTIKAGVASPQTLVQLLCYACK